MYADDILLTLSKPIQSIPRMLQIIDNFGKLSGYKVNWSKSEAILLNYYTYKKDLGTAPFVWKTEGMKYLGITIGLPSNTIMDRNLQPLTNNIKEDLKRWSALPLSLWGRAEVLKMNILPRILSLISSVPLNIPMSWFDDVKKMFSSFLWKDKKPKISLKKLSLQRDQGGLGIPDIFNYYIAFNIRYGLIWGYKKVREARSWDWLEEQLLNENNVAFSLSSLWYHPYLPAKLDNPIMRLTCKTIKKILSCLFFVVVKINKIKCFLEINNKMHLVTYCYNCPPLGLTSETIFLLMCCDFH
uniref:Reverse transcriptase domain-containing protein n=1 Tax=Neogobius melanostomus TaxID=47308 RepID=A0A8C6SDT3_9GOBI